jgi:hypothetical protein
MQIFYADDHRTQFPRADLAGGAFITSYERHNRVERILSHPREEVFPTATQNRTKLLTSCLGA